LVLVVIWCLLLLDDTVDFEDEEQHEDETESSSWSSYDDSYSDYDDIEQLKVSAPVRLMLVD